MLSTVNHIDQLIVSKGSLPNKNYLVRDIVPIPSDTPTIETVSEYCQNPNSTSTQPNLT